MQSSAPVRLVKDLPPLHQHIALHSGLDENDPANTPITYELMIKGLTALGQTDAEAKSTADKVFLAASVKLAGAKGNIFNFRKLTFTIQDAIGLMHPARDTGIYDANGYVKQEVLQELFQDKYVVEEKAGDTAEKYIPASKLYLFRAERFKVSKETHPSSCCAAMFAKGASNGEFASFIQLYPVPNRTIKINGKDEPCFTQQEIDDFYNRPYLAGNRVKERVKEQSATAALAPTLTSRAG